MSLMTILRQKCRNHVSLRHLRQFCHITTNYDKLRQITTFTTFSCYLRHFFYDLSLLSAFVLVLLLQPLPIMVNVEDGLTQIHGVLQSNADSLKRVLVLVGPVPEQSTQAVIKFESAVELLRSGAGARFEVGEVLARVSLPTSMSNSVVDCGLAGNRSAKNHSVAWIIP
jgi:hypothetical protein